MDFFFVQGDPNKQGRETSRRERRVENLKGTLGEREGIVETRMSTVTAKKRKRRSTEPSPSEATSTSWVDRSVCYPAVPTHGYLPRGGCVAVVSQPLSWHLHHTNPWFISSQTLRKTHTLTDDCIYLNCVRT